jgi:hypothetical protein
MFVIIRLKIADGLDELRRQGMAAAGWPALTRCFVRTLLVELGKSIGAAGLPLSPRRVACFGLERAVHAIVAAILQACPVIPFSSRIPT